MKKKRKYTISEKRRLVDAKKADWSKRMRIVELKNEGLTFKEIAKLVGGGRWNTNKLYNKAMKQILD